MGSFSIWHWLIVIVVVLLLFGGRGRLSNLMGDAARGIKSFRDGLKNDDDPSNMDSGDANRAGSLPQSDREREDANR